MKLHNDSRMRLVGRFRRNEEGTATVEAVIWLPFLLFLLAFIADASLIFGAKAEVLRVLQDANRATSIGRLRTSQQTIDYITVRIGGISSSAVVTSVVTAGVVSSTVVIPASDLTATGMFGGMSDFNVRVNAQHMLEA